MNYSQLLESIQSLPDDASVETKKSVLLTIARDILRFRESLLVLRTRAVVTIATLNELETVLDPVWYDAELQDYERELEERIRIKSLCDQC
jgi:hypothetical protein